MFSFFSRIKNFFSKKNKNNGGTSLGSNAGLRTMSGPSALERSKKIWNQNEDKIKQHQKDYNQRQENQKKYNSLPQVDNPHIFSKVNKSEEDIAKEQSAKETVNNASAKLQEDVESTGTFGGNLSFHPSAGMYDKILQKLGTSRKDSNGSFLGSSIQYDQIYDYMGDGERTFTLDRWCTVDMNKEASPIKDLTIAIGKLEKGVSVATEESTNVRARESARKDGHYILPPGTKFEFVDVTDSDNGIIVTLNIVP